MSQYVVGIDLGTTNSVLSYCTQPDPRKPQVTRQIRLFEVEQLVAGGEVQALPLLPSVRYQPQAGELAAQELDLPWQAGDASQPVYGAYARQLGAQVPGRLVASAKSWLSHTAVDRTAPILPWGAAADVAKVSPLQASASYLAYLRAAWLHRFPKAPLEQQEIVLTVPASFDEAARALTVEAAKLAGLPRLRLLEEPQAAFYDWLYRHQTRLGSALAHSQLVLVVDVGGGTTDFSLIAVQHKEEPAMPSLTRIGVGNHLMLGGDNMDLALAHLVETRLAGQSQNDTAQAQKLSSSRLAQLMQRCRVAKEVLLAQDAPSATKVTLLGGGSKLIGAARSVEISQQDVQQYLLDGFFPLVEIQEQPRRSRSAMVEFGLPYAADAAITRHLASFLQQHQTAICEALGVAPQAGQIQVPDTLLLNGGVFRAAALVQRLAEQLQQWRGSALTVLHNDNPDIAVARGAVAYALAQQGRAPKIGGGSARSYFLLVDGKEKSSSTPSGSQQAICILARGTEAGQEQLLAGRSFALRLGQPVRFHLVSSTVQAQAAQLGQIIDLNQQEQAEQAEQTYLPLPPLATVLQSDGKQKQIPVRLATRLTELGTLEIHCVEVVEEADHPADARRWLLQFQLRHSEGAAEAEKQSNLDALPANFAQALEKIERIFGSRAQQVAPKEVKQLRGQLESLLGSRERWPTPLLRQLFDALWQRQKARRRSAEHEKQWLNLIGYCLRPGFGDALDGWRISQLWPLFEAGAQYKHDAQVCVQWWTLWRRVAGGLSPEAQLRLLDDFALNLQGSADDLRQAPNAVPGSYQDMLRLGAALERIPASYKAEIGQWMLQQLDKVAEKQQDILYWALARVGARAPFYGNWEQVVETEVAEQWLHRLLEQDWRKQEAAAFASTHLARMVGERSRDIAEPLRAKVIERLQAAGAPASWVQMVSEVVQLDEQAEQRLMGEALPPGLKLLA